MDYLNYSKNHYYQFTFRKCDYALLSKVLHVSIEVFRLYKLFCPCARVDVIISDLLEIVWQLDTQVERQQFFDSKL